MPSVRDPSTGGAALFARYAYPPNALGYCGPDAAAELLERAAGPAPGPSSDAGLRHLARGFEGAWPYLELIAAANGLGDPLDRRVVEAYWIGNGLLDRVPTALLVRSLEDRFRGRFRGGVGGSWDRLVATAVGARPHHSFHVFGVYPWLGLLRGGRVEEPLRVLDRCRIRTGRVLSLDGDEAMVESRPLAWDGRRLHEGAPRAERVVVSAAGRSLVGPLAPGDLCTLHWDWVCDRVSPHQVAALRRRSAQQLAVVDAARYPAPANVLA
ncbi:DUF6390 family protein [Actinotalea sp.]|uniref:DUF6390 family protein n=1 Tax=Actinotalea sp. TaxID=1872145 RepID=UPI003561FAB6